MCVCDTAEYFYDHVDQQLVEFGLTTHHSSNSDRSDGEGKSLCARDIVDVIEGYKGRGYGLNTEEELGERIWFENSTT